MRRIVVAASAVTIPFVAVTLAFPREVIGIFSPEEAVAEGTLRTLVVVAAAMVIVVPGELWLAALFGTGDSDAALGIEVLATFAMLAFAAVAVFALELDLHWVWLALPLASLLTLVTSYAWVRSGRWRRRVV